MKQANNPPLTRRRLPISLGRVGEGGRRVVEQQNLEYELTPLVSIVTIVFNGVQYIEQTIQSVLSQSYDNFEYILIDCASTDGTVDIIKKYDHALEYWVSEPDCGIANAMNKGIQVSTGNYVMFLHADDYFLDNLVLGKAVSQMSNECDIAAFNILFQMGNMQIECRPRAFNWWLNFKTGLHHQGVFCSRELFNKIGGFDESYKIAMDYELWLRAYRAGVRPKLYDCSLSVIRDTGVSSRTDWPSLSMRFREERRAHLKHVSSIGMKGIYILYWSLYLPYRFFRFKIISLCA